MTNYDFTAAELTAMQTAQVGHMQDRFVPQVYSRTSNAVGEPVVTYTNGDYTDCGLDMRPGSERHTGDNTLTAYDATIRVAWNSTLNTKDRVMVTHRFGTALAVNLVFDVVAPLQQGPSGSRYALKRVET